MPKYNGSAIATSISKRRISSVFGASLAMALAACAQQPERTISAPSMAPAPAAVAAPMPQQSVSEPVQVREDAPLRYVVKKGDTLWDIAAYFLREPWQWPEIWYVNDEIANPHLIYPGDVLTLIWRDGRQVVMRELPTDRMGPMVREMPLADPIPTIPIDRIRDFLKGPYVADEDELDRAPYILAFGESHLIEGEGSTVYLRRLPEQDVSDAYLAIRRGDKYVDPVTGRFLGWEAIPVADIQIEAAGDPGTGLISRSYREARAGDLLVEPPQQSFDANFFPHAPNAGVDAFIISVFDGVSQIGQYDVVALNRGAEDGLEPGHVLDIYQAGRKARDPYTGRQVLLPERYAGNLMVFKVESKVSYALIMKATLQMHVLDRVREPGLN